VNTQTTNYIHTHQCSAIYLFIYLFISVAPGERLGVSVISSQCWESKQQPWLDH